MPETLVIRADGDSQIGTGHVMRCLSLAAGWQSAGGDVVLAIARSSAALLARIAVADVPIVHLDVVPGSLADARQLLDLANSSAAAWIVADGYQFDAAYQRTIMSSGRRLLLIDDYGHADHYCADFVLNQNLSAREGLYENRAAHTRLLLGTRYVLLRRQFLEFGNRQRETSAIARRVLVTLGGADPDNATGKVTKALNDLDVEVKIVVGGSNPNKQNLEAEIRNPISASPPRVDGVRSRASLSLSVDTDDMPALMAWADVAIAASGTTSWELAFMGTPSLVVVLADNQEEVAHFLHLGGVSISLGRIEDLSTAEIGGALHGLLADGAQRAAMSQRGQQLVDGRGVARVVVCLLAATVILRRAEADDCRLIWEWANEQDVRASAFSAEPIAWASHQLWFAERLASPRSAIFVAVNRTGTPFGQVRFDWNELAEAEIDVSVGPEARQRGLGSALIRAGVDEMLRTTEVAVFHALVKQTNTASIRAFEKAGFWSAEATATQPQAVCRLTLTRDNE